MKRNKKFIWLDPDIYPEYQSNTDEGKFCIAEFKKTIYTELPIEVEITADARYMLFVNGEYIGRGPISAGRDFLYGYNDSIYYDTYVLPFKGELEIKVLVTSHSTVLTENTYGYPGLWMNIRCLGLIRHKIDESWDCRLLPSHRDILYTDYTKNEHPYSRAKFSPVAHDIMPSPIDLLDEEKIYSPDFEKITVKPGESLTKCLYFDKIYSAYPYISIKCNSKCTVNIITSEEGTQGKITETVVTDKSVVHFPPRMRSVGQMELEIHNEGNEDVVIDEAYIDYIHYPVYMEADFKTSDRLLNKIYDVCMHTLKICRQSIHLDSPTHQEHLACTGDYYIQSLIEYLNLGDSNLAEWDIRRTSHLINIQKGRLFHTTYSLIYPWWVYDHYMHTGSREVINLTAIENLLNRFDTYISKENGLIEYTFDYMFVDWVVASATEDKFLDGGKMMGHGKMEGYSLHHPPKALGQSVLCMFYYNALLKISEIYKIVGKEEKASACIEKAEKIKESINNYLFDKEKGLYVGGLNTPNAVPENDWLPENTSTVYYLKQANTLAVLFGIAPKEKRQDILEYVIKDLNIYEMQPYFYHYLLNALYNEGMFGKYGFELIERYKVLLDICDKGLREAWENMECDSSHAWGATPAYTLKRALSGLEILEPKFKKIKLSPKLYHLDFAEFDIITPYGNIEISMKKGEDVSIKAPKEIEIVR